MPRSAPPTYDDTMCASGAHLVPSTAGAAPTAMPLFLAQLAATGADTFGADGDLPHKLFPTATVAPPMHHLAPPTPSRLPAVWLPPPIKRDAAEQNLPVAVRAALRWHQKAILALERTSSEQRDNAAAQRVLCDLPAPMLPPPTTDTDKFLHWCDLANQWWCSASAVIARLPN